MTIPAWVPIRRSADGIEYRDDSATSLICDKHALRRAARRHVDDPVVRVDHVDIDDLTDVELANLTTVY